MCALHIVIAGCVKFPINIVHSTIRSIVSETVHPNPNRVDSFVVCPTFYACVSKWIVVCERTCLYVSTPYDNTLNSKSQYIFRNNSYWAHGIAHTPDFEVKSENSAMTIDHFHVVVVGFPAFFFRNHLLCLAKFQMVDNIPFGGATQLIFISIIIAEKSVSHTIKWFLLSKKKYDMIIHICSG